MKLGPSKRLSLWGGVVVTGAGDGVVKGVLVVVLFVGGEGVGLTDVVGVVGVVEVVAEVVLVVGLAVVVEVVGGVAGVVLLGIVPSEINIRVTACILFLTKIKYKKIYIYTSITTVTHDKLRSRLAKNIY